MVAVPKCAQILLVDINVNVPVTDIKLALMARRVKVFNTVFVFLEIFAGAFAEILLLFDYTVILL